VIFSTPPIVCRTRKRRQKYVGSTSHIALSRCHHRRWRPSKYSNKECSRTSPPDRGCPKSSRCRHKTFSQGCQPFDGGMGRRNSCAQLKSRMPEAGNSLSSRDPSNLPHDCGNTRDLRLEVNTSSRSSSVPVRGLNKYPWATTIAQRIHPDLLSCLFRKMRGHGQRRLPSHPIPNVSRALI
jgi:hypothetical protein